MKGGSNFNTAVGSKYSSRTKLPANPFETSNPGTHVHAYGSSDRFGGGTTKSAFDAQNRLGSYETSGGGAHTHSITGGDNETNPPCAVVNWIIKYD